MLEPLKPTLPKETQGPESERKPPPSGVSPCPFAECDGSGFVPRSDGEYDIVKICRCVKLAKRLKHLGEMFYRVELESIQPRSVGQERLKALLLQNPVVGVFLFGPVRSGKTHFFSAMYNHWDDKSSRVKYLNDGMLKDELRNAELNGNFQYFIDLVSDYDHFFIDDAGKTVMSEFHRSALFRFFDELYKQKKHIFITSNFSLAELSDEKYWGSPIGRRIEDMCEIAEFL